MILAVPLMPADDGRSGIYRYLHRMSEALLESAPAAWQPVYFVLAGDRERFEHLPSSAVVEVGRRFAGPASNIVWHLAALPLLTRAHGARALLLPAGNRRLSPLSAIPQVVVVHDLNQLDVPGKYDRVRMAYVRQVVRRGLQRAQALVAVSSHTAEQLARIGIGHRRVTVVPNGVDRARFTEVTSASASAALRSVGLEKGYLLYVSRIEHPGKNHLRLLEAYARLCNRDPAAPPLVLVGSDWNGAEVVHARAEAPDLAGKVVFTGFVDDDLLPGLYQGARALVFPSLAEGFGLPLVEAMASGCPVLCSDRPPMNDIVGEAGVLFEPESAQSIAEALTRIVGDKRLRRRVSRRGRRRAADFDWCSTARRLWAVISQATGVHMDDRTATNNPAGPSVTPHRESQHGMESTG